VPDRSGSAGSGLSRRALLRVAAGWSLGLPFFSTALAACTPREPYPHAADLRYPRPTDPVEHLARELDGRHPGAAASLREGLAETLTVARLGVPPTLARPLRRRVDDRNLPGPLAKREALARREDGAALVRGWDGGGEEAVPTRERSHAPARASPRASRALRRARHTPDHDAGKEVAA
jgi:hypothetical protein